MAEYRGLLLGLERARALGATEVEVVNDSELIAKQVNGDYKVKHADMKPLHAAAHEALRGFERWSIRSVPRAQNADADALVNQALDADPDGADAEPEPARRGAALAAQPPPLPRAGGTDYASYLLIDDLLGLQRPLTPDAHDEMLFIVVHQSYELWFKLILHELTRARDELLAGRAHAAVPRLSRTVAIERLLLDHLDVLETMGPEGFLEFRDPLEPASGFQSVQFRQIEWISGLHDTFPADTEPPPGPSLYEAFVACAGLPDEHEARLEALADLYRDHDGRSRARLAVPGRGAADRPRRGHRAVAQPPRADGRARDRHPPRHRRLAGRAVPQDHARPALLPRAVGRARAALSGRVRAVLV